MFLGLGFGLDSGRVLEVCATFFFYMNFASDIGSYIYGIKFLRAIPWLFLKVWMDLFTYFMISVQL